ncbi:MAG: hypothetical protein EXR75_16645 [Myxococcales bacterium]|nr:hypothetical protein [Myxococcales bacterium]
MRSTATAVVAALAFIGVRCWLAIRCSLRIRCWLGVICSLGVSCSNGSDVHIARPAGDRRHRELGSALPAPARPPWTFALERDGAACSVVRVEGDERRVLTDEPCPRDVEPGERVRLMGATCMRESQNADRNLPIRCPGGLLAAPKRELNPR